MLNQIGHDKITLWKIYGDNLGSSLRLMEETMAAQNQVSEADLEALEALKKEGEGTHFPERTVNSLCVILRRKNLMYIYRCIENHKL